MAKVSKEAKLRYTEEITHYRKSVEDDLLKEKELLKLVQSSLEDHLIEYFSLCELNLSSVANYLIMNELSLSLLGIKNENFLNESRKSCYKSILYLEKLFGNNPEQTYIESKEYLSKIESLDEFKRYQIIRYLGFFIDRVKISFGDNTKWKWSLIELEARLAVLSKNCIDLKPFIMGLDPRSKGFKIRLQYFKLVSTLLEEAAKSYRLKYEISTRRSDDFKLAIKYLNSLLNIYRLMGQKQKVLELKKKIESWTMRLDNDLKQSLQKEKTQRLSSGK